MIFQLSLAYLSFCKPLVKLLTFLFACFEQLYGCPVWITGLAHKTGCSLAAHLQLTEGRSAPDTSQMTGPSPNVYTGYLLTVLLLWEWFFYYFKYTALSQIWLYVVSCCHCHSSFILTNPISYFNSWTLRSELHSLTPSLALSIPNEQKLSLKKSVQLTSGRKNGSFWRSRTWRSFSLRPDKSCFFRTFLFSAFMMSCEYLQELQENTQKYQCLLLQSSWFKEEPQIMCNLGKAKVKERCLGESLWTLRWCL